MEISALLLYYFNQVYFQSNVMHPVELGLVAR